MHADGLHLEYFGVTFAAIHRVEAAPVSAIVRANMTVETISHAVYGRLELREIGFVTIEAGVLLFYFICMKRDWQAGEKEREGSDELVHGNAQYE